ncbi:MAG: ribosome small subunit-dependent GTPase A [Anaerolineales bacterium]|nr:ribosome small subunit-dependent GTPase A [Anaerolineales bacterium]
MSSDFDPSAGSPTFIGTVYKKSQGSYTVRSTAGQLISCSTSNRLRKVLIYPTAAPTSLAHRVREVKEIRELDPVAVGDVVRAIAAPDGTGLITEVQPRRNALTRRAASDHGAAGRTSQAGFKSQVIAANVDQIVAVLTAAGPAPKWELLDRYLAAAELAGVGAFICLTKADLLDEAVAAEALLTEVRVYQSLGYAVAVVSAESGAGLEEVRGCLRGRLSVCVGKSGTGKTTLLNALQPGLGLRVKAVNAVTGKGKHTTTHLEMFDLDFGGQVVDTPGMREFGLDRLDLEDLAYGFVELRPYLGACKFGLDCTHAHEPGCAVKAAVAAGAVSERRYRSYLRMREA